MEDLSKAEIASTVFGEKENPLALFLMKMMTLLLALEVRDFKENSGLSGEYYSYDFYPLTEALKAELASMLLT